jgi:predicted membrane-bound spermidine synthase
MARQLSDARKKSRLGLAISLCICLGFILAAHLIGNKYSCSPVANLYYWGGLLAVPVLLTIPFVCVPRLHIARRILLALVNVVMGIATWAWAHDFSGMYFMCRMF